MARCTTYAFALPHLWTSLIFTHTHEHTHRWHEIDIQLCAATPVCVRLINNHGRRIVCSSWVFELNVTHTEICVCGLAARALASRANHFPNRSIGVLMCAVPSSDDKVFFEISTSLLGELRRENSLNCLTPARHSLDFSRVSMLVVLSAVCFMFWNCGIRARSATNETKPHTHTYSDLLSWY